MAGACTRCKAVLSGLLFRRSCVRGVRLLSQQVGKDGDNINTADPTHSSSDTQTPVNNQREATQTKFYKAESSKDFSSSTATTDADMYEEEEEGDYDGYNSEEPTEETQEEYDMKQRILSASLAFVHEHGWTQKALSAGAASEGLPPVAHGMFPRGGADLVFYFQRSCNQHLADHLKSQSESATEEQEKPKTKDYIRSILETRLRMIIPYIDMWPQAIAIQTMPQNAPEAWLNLVRLMDDIWYYSGDRSTDFNWYTKRASLAAVYKSTEIFMLQDKSENFTDTWDFLDRRLTNLTDLGSMVKNSKQTTDVLSEGLTGALLMSKNILGVGLKFRKP